MPDFTTYTDRELVNNMLDRAASLSWRLEAEQELERRSVATRDQVTGHFLPEDQLLGAIRLKEMRGQERDDMADDSRDVRLTEHQLTVATTACKRRVYELERRLARSSYDSKPGMKSAIVEELATVRELAKAFEHNADQLRRQKVERINAKLGI